MNAVMIQYPIHCPACGKDHVDAGEWEDKPHHTHLCEHCGAEFDFYAFGKDIPSQDKEIIDLLNIIHQRGIQLDACRDSKYAYRERMLEHAADLDRLNARMIEMENELGQERYGRAGDVATAKWVLASVQRELDEARQDRDRAEVALRKTISNLRQCSLGSQIPKEALDIVEPQNKILGLKAQIEAADCGLCGKPHGAGHVHEDVIDCSFCGEKQVLKSNHSHEGWKHCRECYVEYIGRGDDGFCSDSCMDKYDLEYGGITDEDIV
jgi:hypothetical protein